jgi:RimJ/RimL family protein N-acetyltransferase
MRSLPPLETKRLLIRPFTLDDLDDAHRLLDQEAFPPGYTLEERREWLQWTVLNTKHLAMLYQPPYGDRAFVLKETGELIGSVGIVPYMSLFGIYPFFGGRPDSLATAEVGLFWATSTPHRGNGYAAEAARAVIHYLFTHENLGRIIATTEYDNLASQAVMRKLGMTVERNPFNVPPWAQVLGILENTN